MEFIESRGNDGNKPPKVPFSRAILSPSASFGGLYIPESIPALDADELERWGALSYKELAASVLGAFGVDVSDAVIRSALECYDRFDDPSNPVPLADLGDGVYVSELWHGPTRAFKDMALQPFGVVLSELARERGEQYLILAATSGDTGPAALATFEGKPGVKVACLYPDGGTSDVQRLQMVTMSGSNLKVIGVHGNFDDTQNALKSLLASEAFNQTLADHGTMLSAANSVNFGRIIFQTIYHLHSYLELRRRGVIKAGEAIDLIVPSGNFGNALGAYYAKKMGTPIGKILIASNDNNILTELITEGRYDLKSKTLKPTSSPAMDILKSSNVERVLYDLFGPERTKELMEDLARNDAYALTPEELAMLQEEFDATWSGEDEVNAAIKAAADQGYILDPHTATCMKCLRHREPGRKIVAYSTAEWTKFSPTVWAAVSGEKGLHDAEALEKISAKFGLKVPPMIKEVFEKPVKHELVVEKEKIEEAIASFI